MVIPVAYYLHRRGVTNSYLDSTADAPDRDAIRRWATRSLMKRGIWGSGLDTMLAGLRKTIDENGSGGFPVKALEETMASAGKSLAFDDAEIDELLGLKYGHARTFTVLATLYPGLDFSRAIHEDHFFPKSMFTPSKFVAQGVPADQVPQFCDRVNLLPNLQLLAGTVNQEKLNALPADWMDAAFSNPQQRTAYEQDNDLDGLPLGLADFLSFFEQREQRMRQRLQAALSTQTR